MSRFDECCAIVFGEEGGHSNVKGDRGGNTMAGITQDIYNAYRKRCGKSPLLVEYSTPEERTSILLTDFWKPVHADVLPAPLDLVVFDMAVNSGPSTAVKYLQRALGVGDDGVVGPHTIDAVQEDAAAGRIPEVVSYFLSFRETFYRKCVDNDPEDGKFLDGWLNRIAFLRKLTNTEVA